MQKMIRITQHQCYAWNKKGVYCARKRDRAPAKQAIKQHNKQNDNIFKAIWKRKTA